MDDHITPFRISQAAQGYVQLLPWEIQHLKVCEKCSGVMRAFLRIFYEIPA